MRGKFLLGAASAALLFGLAGAANAQSTDPAGDSSTQARLSVGEAVNGTLYPAGDRDWYRLSVQPGQRYNFALNSAAGGEQALDPMLALYNSAGEQIALNDDSEGTLNSALRYQPSEAGEIFVEARGFAEDAAGGYVLQVQASAAPVDSVGNDASTRARVAAGAPVSGSIDSEGDLDWYRFSARTGQIYRMTLVGGEGADALGDTLLRVVDGDGTELAMNDDDGQSLNSALEWTPTSNGDVYVEASAFGGQATGNYTLNIESSRLPPDNSASDQYTRSRLSAGMSANDTIDYVNDRDWRRIRLEAGQSYRFSLNSDTNAATPLTDPLLKIFSPSGEELAMDDDGGDGFNSYLEFTAPTSGNYFLEASAFGESSTGAYTISAARGDIPADSSTDAALAPDGDYREGTLSPAGDKDWFRLNLIESQGLRISVTSLEGGGEALGDPYIAIYGPNGEQVATDDDGGEGLNAWLEYTAATAGAYYLEVRGFVEEAGAGRYAIQITGGEVGASADTSEFINTIGEGRSSTISGPGDADWWGVSLVEGRPYRFYLDSNDGTLDPMLRLYDQNGAEVASDDDGGSGTNSYLSFISTTGGVYYLGASAFGDQGAGAYTLRISDTDVPGMNSDEYLATEGDDRISRIDMPGDLDGYSIMLEAGANYTIEVKGHGEDPLTDPFVAILNSGGERVTSDDDSGDGLDARLRFSPSETDQFLIQASGLGGSTGGYQIVVTRN
jgi:hypothetical protein